MMGAESHQFEAQGSELSRKADISFDLINWAWGKGVEEAG